MSSSLARKVTPFYLAKPKMKIGVEKLSYNHASQSVTRESRPAQMVTFNATQTFDSQGRAKDKDSDK
jgi:hypothetical protein